MSIKSGQRYKIKNEENGLVFDLYFYKTIVGHAFHGADNQQVTNITISIICPLYDHDSLQWITEKQDDGQWTIRSVRHQKYLGFDNTPDNGTPIVGIDKPRLWDIEILSDSEDDDNPRVKYVLCTFIPYPTGNDRS
jgi:hypothetical protein